MEVDTVQQSMERARRPRQHPSKYHQPNNVSEEDDDDLKLCLASEYYGEEYGRSPDGELLTLNGDPVESDIETVHMSDVDGFNLSGMKDALDVPDGSSTSPCMSGPLDMYERVRTRRRGERAMTIIMAHPEACEDVDLGKSEADLKGGPRRKLAMRRRHTVPSKEVSDEKVSLSDPSEISSTEATDPLLKQLPKASSNTDSTEHSEDVHSFIQRDRRVSMYSQVAHPVKLYQEYNMIAQRRDCMKQIRISVAVEGETPSSGQGDISGGGEEESSGKVAVSWTPDRSHTEAPSGHSEEPSPDLARTYSSFFSLWQELPEVQSSGVLATISQAECSRQEAMYELVTSEASYLRSLEVALHHFQDSCELQKVTSQADKHALFSNLADVTTASVRFLQDLETRVAENILVPDICDIVSEHTKKNFHVYIPYVTNQSYQEQTLQKLRRTNAKFSPLLEHLQEDPICNRLSLQSFLILPFQRIVRIKILLENILKKTEPHSRYEETASVALKALARLIQECNENARKMKRTEELIHLHNTIEFDKMKSLALISPTRWLVKHGELLELAVSRTAGSTLMNRLMTKRIYLHLFNDILILSRRKDGGKFTVFCHADRTKVELQSVGAAENNVATDNSFYLLLDDHDSRKYRLLLRAASQSEKERWVEAIAPPQRKDEAALVYEGEDCPQVYCLKAYVAQEPDELSLDKGDILSITRKTSDGWMEGVRLSDAEKGGWFPTANVAEITNVHVRTRNIRDHHRLQLATQNLQRKHS
uniref:Rho guanine nucleotide exchange factor 19-like isoform X1 n=1 Tax=Petromyzon marinus TaxID=7757 RepID=A0AAJ7X8P0_PETMA|nr:rho guanine nucleotide exchange factor 19-like isoform X1 [Petromyzon marinus]XP_032824154.1 rho guanine nucleotide exchange factor 19-like isoform X1 [Petromyzon marinus]